MDWQYWKGKHIFVQLKSGGFYSGDVINVDESSPPLIFFELIDKFGEKVTFVQSEIIKIKEEKKDGIGNSR